MQEESSKGKNTGISSTGIGSPHKESKPTAPKTPPPEISQDCGGGNCAASVGQQGGITAGVLNLGPPVPKCEVTRLAGPDKESDGTNYATTFQLVLVSQSSVGLLLVQAEAPNVQQVIAVRRGAEFKLHK